MARKAYYHTTLTLTEKDQESREKLGEQYSLIGIFRKGLEVLLKKQSNEK